MRDRLARYASAVLVSVIATFCGFARQAAAETPVETSCTLNDVFAWQMQLEQPQEEASPAYIRRVSEAFIDACPARPERRRAHQIAGLAAGWNRDSEGALTHLRQAGDLRDTEALFMAAAAELHAGNSDTAWQLRDRAIDLWLTRIERSGAQIITEESGRGMIHRVRFPSADGTASILWLAAPDGAGWPAALSLKSSAQLNAFHRLVSGAAAGPISQLRLYRCQSRRLLGQSNAPLADTDLDARAQKALSAYLTDPDRGGDDFEVCIFADDMLAAPSPQSQLLTR